MAAAGADVKWWQAPSEKSAQGASTGFAAKFWTWADGVYETSGKADPGAHTISFCLDPLQTEFSLGRQTTFNGLFSPGMMAIIPAGEEPKAVQRGPARKLHLYLPISLWQDATADYGSSNHPELRTKGVIEDVSAQNICSRILSVLSRKEPGSRMLMDALGIELTILGVRRWSSLTQTTEPEDRSLGITTLARVLTYLNDNLAKDTTLIELGAIAGLSPAHFCRSFRKTTGKPPHRYVLEKRIEKAKELLSKTTLSIEEVAASIGYDDPSYFARLFKKQLGVTPRQFRNSLV